MFQAWLLQVKAESGCFIKILRVDNSRVFISIKLRLFGEKGDIVIKYATLYIYEENS